MPTDTRIIKQRLTTGGDFTEAQASTLIDAFFGQDDPVITRSVLRAEMDRLILRIVLAVAAINGLYLAAAALL